MSDLLREALEDIQLSDESFVDVSENDKSMVLATQALAKAVIALTQLAESLKDSMTGSLRVIDKGRK